MLYLSLINRLYRLQWPYIFTIILVAIVGGLAWIVAVHGELLGGARDAVIVKEGVDQGRRAVSVTVKQSLYRGGGRRVIQRRHGRRFVVLNDLRRWTHRRAISDLRMDLRGRCRRADGTLTAEQLI